MQKSLPHKKDIKEYFEEELHFLSAGGKEFAKNFPTTASHLRMNSDGNGDPHVQQLFEAFAFMAANLQKQIDQSTLSFSQSMLKSVSPALVEPIPSMSLVQFDVNASHSSLSKGVSIPRGSLFIQDSKIGINFKFQTAYDTLLFPGEILSTKASSSINYENIKDKNKKIIDIKINMFSRKNDPEQIKSVRFYINGGKQNSTKIYDIIFSKQTEAYIECENKEIIKINKKALKKVGFKNEESILLNNKKSPESFKNFLEYFVFPEKYLFFEIDDLDINKIGKTFSILFECSYFDESIISLENSTFQLRVTPIVNFFSMISEPVISAPNKKSYKLYTNHLKENFVFFHSVSKLKTIDKENNVKEITPVENYSKYLIDLKENFFYNVSSKIKDPNCFEIEIYNKNENIFIENLTLYADINATNGCFCEKIHSESEIYSVKNFPINKAKIIKNPSKYIEPKDDSDFYWKSSCYIMNEKLNFTNSNNLMNDLKSIMSIYLEILSDKERGNLIINSIENIEIEEKIFKIDPKNIYSFLGGKEIIIYINPLLISGESIIIFSEIIYDFLCKITNINQCISINIIDNHSKRTVHTCSPNKGSKSIL